MGGRGGSSGLNSKKQPNNKQKFDKNFKRYDVQGESIYKSSPGGYFLYDYETDNIAGIYKTLREAKESVSKNIEARKREIERIKKKVSNGKASDSEKESLSRLIRRESARRRREK